MKNENYIIIQGWMINQLKLKGNELLLFALIYGFSQDGKSQYKGSLTYISAALKVSKPTTISLKDKLKTKGFIIEISDKTGNRFSANLIKIKSVLSSAEIAPLGGKETLPLGSKETLLLGSKETLPLGSKETLPNNYNNKYINSSKGKFAEISNNYKLIEQISRDQKIKIDTVKHKIPDFINHTESIDNLYNNRKELFQHFGNWMRKQNLKDIDLNEEFTFFIKMFNQISKKEFVGTQDIKELFTTAILNGFNGRQMLKAIYNLYSSSEKNKWHRKNNWEFATPEHLLKNENLNKYLNANY